MTPTEVAALRVGDEVGVTRGYGMPPVIAKVTRRTATVVIVGDLRFNKYGSSSKSSSFNRRWLIGVDDARKAIANDVRRNGESRIRNRLRDYAWSTLGFAQCERVLALLKEIESEREKATA